MDKIAKGFGLVFEGISECVDSFVGAITNLAKSINIAMLNDPEIKKYQMIAKRTKNRRIKKKQLSMIRKKIDHLK